MRNRPDRVSYAVATTNDLAARIWSSSATQQSFAIADELAANPNSIRWKRDITINDVDSGDFDEGSGDLRGKPYPPAPFGRNRPTQQPVAARCGLLPGSDWRRVP